ncbi:MAG: heme-binding protein [Methylophilaceae bacterium]
MNPIERLFQYAPRTLLVAMLSTLLVACGGGGSSSDASNGVNCSFPIASTPQSLTAPETQRIIAQAEQAAGIVAPGVSTTIAVVDRVGNVLGVYNTTGNDVATATLQSGRFSAGPNRGLDRLSGVPGTAALGAITKAITGAYLSSSGNAFSTRTASFIIQEHFPPTVISAANPSGPLFGVQFSQLPCGDFITRGAGATAGPKRSPFGLAGDPGGFPIYKNGVVVGGIGVISDASYSLDLNPTAGTTDNDERIAQSALAGFQAPDCIRANRITLGGQIPSYSNADKSLVSVSNSTVTDVAKFIDVDTYYVAAGGALAGQAYGNATSGFAAEGTSTLGAGAFIVTNGAVNRFAPRDSVSVLAGADALTVAEVTQIINSAIGVANQTRAQIRNPRGSAAQVTVSIVDDAGNVLGIARTSDAPIFGADVSLQKARTAAFFSNPQAGTNLANEPNANIVGGSPASVSVANYVAASNTFFGSAINPIFDGGNAFSARAIGNISRPFFPDGDNSQPKGPLSKNFSEWSPFNTGLQLDLVYNKFVDAITQPILTLADTSCTTLPAQTVVDNGLQIFPGGVPIYRGNRLIGAIGVSGDGVDQDDMVAFLGLKRGSTAIAGNPVQNPNGPPANAPAGIRADTLAPSGSNLRYVQCPQSPFINSSQQNVCSGI